MSLSLPSSLVPTGLHLRKTLLDPATLHRSIAASPLLPACAKRSAKPGELKGFSGPLAISRSNQPGNLRLTLRPLHIANRSVSPRPGQLPFLSRLLPLFLSESGQLTGLITGCLPFPGFLLFQQLLLCFGLQSLLFGRIPCSLFRSL